MMLACVSIVTRIGSVLAAKQVEGDESSKSSSFKVLLITVLLGGIVAASFFMFMYRTKLKTVISKILGSSEYILHVYDHCPYCVRVELALAFLGVPYTRVLYGYGDTEGPT